MSCFQGGVLLEEFEKTSFSSFEHLDIPPQFDLKTLTPGIAVLSPVPGFHHLADCWFFM